MTDASNGQSVPGNYSYVKYHTINGSVDSALTDYSMRFVVHRGGGNDSGPDVYLNNRSQSWPYDIRFNDSSNSALAYWIESHDANNSTVWVKIGSIPKAPNNTTIRLLYGRAGDVDGSDPAGAFLAFRGPENASFNDTVDVGCNNVSYHARIERDSSTYSNWSYGLSSPDGSDLLSIAFDNASLNDTYRHGIAKNGEYNFTTKSMMVTGGTTQWTWMFGYSYTYGTYAFNWDGSGKVRIAGDANGLTNTWARDGLTISTENGSLSFSGALNIGEANITSICKKGTNNITVTMWAYYGSQLIGCGNVYIYTTGNGGPAVVSAPGIPEVGKWYDLQIARGGDFARFDYNGSTIGTVGSSLPDEGLSMYFLMDNGSAAQAYSFVRKYTPNEPTHGAWNASASSLPDLAISSDDIIFGKVV